MVIQLIYLQPDGSRRTRTYRGVPPWSKSEMMRNFYAERTMYRGGQMIQLKGNERRVVAKFGEEF